MIRFDGIHLCVGFYEIEFEIAGNINNNVLRTKLSLTRNDYTAINRTRPL